MNTQILYRESQPPAPRPARAPVSPTGVMIRLAACMALQMTSYVMILPLFARRFSDLGAGVAALGTSSLAYALAATVAAPFMGALSDRIGRRPLVVGSLAVYVLAFTGYLLAPSAGAIILLRGLAGALTAGLIPAATGMVSDLAPADRRAQWVGILSGGASVGWIAGPILGGLLYDQWGYSAALLAAIAMALAALATAFLGVRETGASHPKPRPAIRVPGLKPAWDDLRSSLPASIAPIVAVLCTYFVVLFAWAFIEPRFMFYAYDDLHWSSSTLGLMMSVFGVAMMAGELGLGRLSDRLGRLPVIVAGLVLFSAQFLGLAFSRSDVVIAVAFTIAGLGNALFDPALTASILDTAPAGHQARMLGIKSTVGSLGNILGPALVVWFTPLMQAQGAFAVSAGLVLVMALLVLLQGLGRTQRHSLVSSIPASREAHSLQPDHAKDG